MSNYRAGLAAARRAALIHHAALRAAAKQGLVFFVLLWGAAELVADPPDAVVRLPSHGASGTVIHTERGRSLILSCAHAFEGAARTTPIKLDVPCLHPGPPRKARVRLLAVDYRLDLSLVELDDGPLDYVCPVAPLGHRPRRGLSVGYDEMRLPARQAAATLLGSDRGITFTREIPWHGRSGGALIDLDGGYLIGVVQGYEVSGARRGLYVSHAAIVEFLKSLPSPLRGRGVGGEGLGKAPSPPAPLPRRGEGRPMQLCPT